MRWKIFDGALNADILINFMHGRIEAIDGDRGDVDAKALLPRKCFGEVQEQPTIAAA